MEIILKLAVNFIIVAITFFIIAVVKYYMKKPKGAENIELGKEIKENVNINMEEIENRKVYVLENKEKVNEDATIIYIHGGAYVGGITTRHWNFIYRILNDTKMKIVLPDYPLAPKHSYKDVFGMFENVYDKYKDEKNLIFMGDSAGGAIALAFTQKLISEGKKQPEKLILISPWLDITMKNEEINEKEKEDTVLKRSVLKVAAEMYADKEDMNNYLLSPVNGEVDNITKVSIFTGTSDMLNPDVHVLQDKFVKANNEKIKVYERENAIHNWIIDDMNAKEDYENFVKEILEF